MADIPRLNGVIKALEEGKTAFTTFSPADIDSAAALGAAPLDGVVFEMEHGPFDAPNLRDALQHMLGRRQILDGGTLAPAVTPMVRIPPNGGEMNQWIAKQVLDLGVYGIVFPTSAPWTRPGTQSRPAAILECPRSPTTTRPASEATPQPGPPDTGV